MCGTTPGSAYETPYERAFELPLAMNDTTSICVREVPCALNHLVHNGVSRKILGSLHERACQRNFLDWVQKIRPGDLYGSVIEESELKMCPMIWCRKTFETNELAIRHAFACPRLSNAWYWCPYHRRPERFLECNKGCEIKQKPKVYHAAQFFKWFGRKRSLKRQSGFEEKILIDPYQDQLSKQELEGTNIQRFESPGSDPPSSASSHNTTMAEWVDEKASYARRQSRIAEVLGDDVCLPELPSPAHVPHEMYDPSGHPTKLPTSSSLRRRSSPELLHPVKSESDRDSLWQRIRGITAADRHGSVASQSRSDRPLLDNTETMISSSSWEPPKLDDGLLILPGDGDGIPTSNAALRNSIPLDRSSDPNRPWTSALQTPVSPNISFSSPTSFTFSPISPIARTVYPPSTVVSPYIVACNDSGSGAIQLHEETTNGWVALDLSPIQSPPKEPNNTRTAFTSQPYSPSSRLVSVDNQSRHWGTLPSNPESLTYLNHLDESSKSETSSSMVSSMVAQIDTPQSESFDLLQCESSSESLRIDALIGSTSQFKGETVSPLQPTRPATAFYTSSVPNTVLRRTSFVAKPVTLMMEMGNTTTSEIRADRIREAPSSAFCGLVDMKDAEMNEDLLGKHDGQGSEQEQEKTGHVLELAHAGNLLSFPEVQLPSPFDSLIATIASEINSAGSLDFSNSDRQQTATQQHDRELQYSQEISTKSLQHCFNCNSLLVRSSAPKQVQVEEQQQLVCTVNTEWMKRMESMPELWLRCNPLLPSNLFERAIRTLREFTRGKIAQTFEDVVAIIHLALAAAFSSHRQQDFVSGNTFYEDALQWQHGLSNDKDKALFLNAITCWWLPEHELSPLPNDSPRIEPESKALADAFHCSNQADLLDTMRNGEVFKACIGFLDGFESADFTERNAQFPANELAIYAQSRAWNIGHMIEFITQPLQQESGIEALRRIVIDTELLIDCGQLQNTREVEVALLTSGRWSSESHEVFERFYDSVTSRCDEAMLLSEMDSRSDWRDAHYVYDLDRVLEILKSLDREQSNEFELKRSPSTSVLALTRHEPPSLDSPVPWSSISNGADTLDSSPTSPMSWTFTGSSHTVEDNSQTTSPTDISQATMEANSQTTSPTDISQATVSPTSLDSNSPTPPVVSCPACSKVFKGTLQDAMSNRRRHLRESPRHNKDSGLKCPQPECSKRPRMRPDNLKPHLLKVHKMSSLSELERIVKNARLMRMDSEGVSRRRSRRA